jgi:hypothetical protein
MLPVPAIKYIPKIFSDNSPDLSATLADKMDDHLTAWLAEIIAEQFLLSPDRCPEILLRFLANYLAADYTSSYTEAEMRVAIVHAVETHKLRGVWWIKDITGTYLPNFSKAIDDITGQNCQIVSSRWNTYSVGGSAYPWWDIWRWDDWIETGDGLVETEPQNYYGVEIGNRMSGSSFPDKNYQNIGNIELGQYDTFPEVSGNIFIDLVTTQTSGVLDQIEQIFRERLKLAYFYIHLGYMAASGGVGSVGYPVIERTIYSFD